MVFKIVGIIYFFFVFFLVINLNNIKIFFGEINLDDNKNKLSIKDLSNVLLIMWLIDKYINVWYIKICYYVV